MARIGQLKDLSLSDNRPTFIGRPVEAIQQTNEILDTRYKQNKLAYENAIDDLNNLSVEKQNQFYVDNQINSTKQAFKDVISTNNFEFSDRVVSNQVREIKDNRGLKESVKSYAMRQQYLRDIDEMVKSKDLDVTNANKAKTYAAMLNTAPIKINEDGTVENSFSAPDVQVDPKINEQLDKYTAKLKADKTPVPIPGTNKYMHWQNGQWFTTVDHKSINEVRATQAITKMLENAPENRAWYAQLKRWDDVDRYAKDDNGNFLKDENGNLVNIDEEVDFKQKLATINIGDEWLETYKKQYDSQHADTGDVLNLDTMSEDELQDFYRTVYDSQYLNRKLADVTRAAVAVVDFDEFDTKWHEDTFAVFKKKQAYKKKMEEQQRKNAPTITLPGVLAGGNDVESLGELGTKAKSLKAQYDSGVQNLEEQLKLLNIDGKLIMRNGKGYIQVNKPDGSSQLMDVRSIPNANGSLLYTYISQVEDVSNQLNHVNALYDAQYDNLDAETKARVDASTTDLSALDINEIIGKLSPEDVQVLRDRGILPQADSWGNFMGMGDFIGLTGTRESMERRKAFIEVLPSLQSAQPVLAQRRNEAISEESPVLKARTDASFTNLRDITSNVEGKGKIISPKDKDFYDPALAQGQIDKNLMFDANGKDIGTMQSNLVSPEEVSLILASNPTITYVAWGGPPRLAYTGTFTDADGVTNTKTVFRYEDDPAYASSLLFNDERQQSEFDRMFVKDAKNYAGVYSKTYKLGEPGSEYYNEHGQPLTNSIKVERIPFTYDGEVTRNNQANANKWKYQVTILDTGERIPVNNIQDVTPIALEYSNYLNGSANKGVKKVKKVKPQDAKTN